MNKKNNDIVKGAKLTFTISAIIEGIYFGLIPLLYPKIYFQFATFESTGVIELPFIRLVSMLALALGFGCWYARTGSPSVVKLMSRIMVLAKGGSTIIIISMFVTTEGFKVLYWINPILTLILVILNVRQYFLAKNF